MRIKPQYMKPLLTLCNPNKNPLVNLTSHTGKGAYDITLTQTMNECSQLTFKMIYNNKKLSYNDCEKLIKFGFDYYVIKDISVADEANSIISVTCQHESVELKGIICEVIDEVGISPLEMFNAIMKASCEPNIGYKFKGTDISKNRHLQCDSEQSVYENLVEMAKVFDGWLEFSTDVTGQKWIYLRGTAIKSGKFVKKGKELKELNITYNSDEIFTRLEVFGATDKDGVESNIMGVNPTGKSFVENYSYFLAMGMTIDEILKTPRCLQRKIMRDDTYVDAKDLYQLGLDEIVKCCVPKLNATISMSDVSVWEGSAKTAPVVGEEIIVVDKDIKFNISCRITQVERNYSTPSQPQITISNVVKYDSVFKDLMHTADVVDKITSSDPDTGKPILMAQYVQGKIDAHVASIVGMLDTIEKPEDKYAILFECRVVGHALFGALALGSRGLLCANELDTKNAWIWRTAISAEGVSATEVNTGTLNATLIKAGVLSDLTGKTWINMETGTFNFANKVIWNGSKFSIILATGKDLDTKMSELDLTDKSFDVAINNPTTGLKAQLKMTSDKIGTYITSNDNRSSTIEQSIGKINLQINDPTTGMLSQIALMAGEISSKVDEGDFGSLIRQHARDIQVAWNGISNYVNLDDTIGLTLGNTDTGTYSRLRYDGRLELVDDGVRNAYKTMVYAGSVSITCDSGKSYTNASINLPSMFSGLNDSDMRVVVGIKKMYDSNLGGGLHLPYWFGAYASIIDGKIELEVMSTWRQVIYDTDNSGSYWVKGFDSVESGRIDVMYVVVG